MLFVSLNLFLISSLTKDFFILHISPSGYDLSCLKAHPKPLTRLYRPRAYNRDFMACYTTMQIINQCAVPENIHPPPTEDFFVLHPTSSQEILVYLHTLLLKYLISS